MIFRVGLENNFEGRSIAWSLEHPGCFACGASGEEALANFPEAIRSYAHWIREHGAEPWFQPEETAIRLEETWEVYNIDEDYERVEVGYEVNAWFLHDWKPLTAAEIERGLVLLSWSRADLLKAVEGLSAEALETVQPGEHWSILKILGHVAGAELWYLHRLGLAPPRSQVPDDPFQKLEVVRAHLVETLPAQAGSRQVTGVDGEFWSPRKLLRRAVWHELDHVGHINKLIGPVF